MTETLVSVVLFTPKNNLGKAQLTTWRFEELCGAWAGDEAETVGRGAFNHFKKDIII